MTATIDRDKASNPDKTLRVILKWACDRPAAVAALLVRVHEWRLFPKPVDMERKFADAAMW